MKKQNAIIEIHRDKDLKYIYLIKTEIPQDKKHLYPNHKFISKDVSNTIKECKKYFKENNLKLIGTKHNPFYITAGLHLKY